MRGSVDTVKEKLDISEIISGYVKLEKAGQSFKARCPFHNEKTPSFFVSPIRQSYYCFGCGAKGDVFTFVQEVEGLDFSASLKLLAEKAGVELEYKAGESKGDKDKAFEILEVATEFFENEFAETPEAKKYVKSRGLTEESVKKWRIGYAADDWRVLWSYLVSLGYKKDEILKAGLAKPVEGASKEPYDTFRDRIIFPIFDTSGRTIAFSGRALGKETAPKYLNSPESVLFKKSEVLYGLDKAKEEIRKKNFAVLVEGQVDLVLSHQAGVTNTVASSGTAFTSSHLERLKKLSSRIILAFDGDSAGEVAAKKASDLALALGLEVKIAPLPEGSDPAEVANKSEGEWKNILRQAVPAIEFFFAKIAKKEKDKRKLGLQVVKQILPMIKLLGSSVEQSHFISLVAKGTGIKEEVLWDDLKKVKADDALRKSALSSGAPDARSTRADALRDTFPSEHRPQGELIEERLKEIAALKKELPKSSPDIALFEKELEELKNNLENINARDKLASLSRELEIAEKAKDSKEIGKLTKSIKLIHEQMRALEESR